MEKRPFRQMKEVASLRRALSYGDPLPHPNDRGSVTIKGEANPAHSQEQQSMVEQQSDSSAKNG